MRLSLIEAAGFRGVKQRITVPCPSGFLIIVGPNGSGKSTICDAIEYCITGQIRNSSHKEKGETIADYLWWRGRGTPSERFVRLSFVDEAGKVHTVTRTPAGVDEASMRVIKSLYSDAGAPETPLIGLCRTSILRDEEITTLSIDLAEGDRYRFVRDALGNVEIGDIESRIDRIRGIVESRLRQEEPNYRRLRDHVADLTARISAARAAMVAESEIREADTALRQTLGLRDANTEDLLHAARANLMEGRQKLDLLHRLLEQIQQCAEKEQGIQSAEFQQRERELQQQNADLEHTLAEQSGELEQIENAVTQLSHTDPERARRAQLLEDGQRLGLLPNDSCPLCGATLSPEAFANHINSERQSLQSLAAQVVEAVNRRTELQQQRDHVNTLYERRKKELNDCLARRQEVDAARRHITEEATRLGVLMNAGASHVDADQVRQRIDTLRATLTVIERSVACLETSSVAEMVRALEAELGNAKQRSEEAFAATSRIEKAISKVKEASSIVRSVRGEIIDEQLAELSPLIEELYKRLRPHVEWTQMSYRLRGDVRRFLSFEIGNGLNPSFVFSSGQRRAAGLAFLLAVHLSRPWCNWQSLVLDDPVQHVDDFRALNLTEVLAAIRKSGRQVICAVEDEALGQLMCRRLRSKGDQDGGTAFMRYDREEGVTVGSMTAIRPLRSGVLIPA